MANAKELRIKICECCGYKKYSEILTAHHIFKKAEFPKQPPLKRKYRYIVLCPNCHAIYNKNIQSKELEIILKITDEKISHTKIQ